jgi:hypothetical protein
MSKHSTFFVDLDLGDKVSSLTIIDAEGDLIEETRQITWLKTRHEEGCLIDPLPPMLPGDCDELLGRIRPDTAREKEAPPWIGRQRAPGSCRSPLTVRREAR